ncbi:MAG: hypothetical protein ACFFC6_08360 [Promethearchaeota archaeon]
MKITSQFFLNLLVLFLILTTVNPANSWASKTHSWIANKAKDEIIKFIPGLEEDYDTVCHYSTVPDSWRAYAGDEGPNHYFDYPNGPGRVDKAILSWSIYLAKELGQVSLDYKLIAKIAGILSHYTSDCAMPLHCTTNYDPPDASFSHEDIDSWLERSANFDVVKISDLTPQFIPDIHNYTINQIETNYHIAEDQLIPAMYNGNTTQITTIVGEQISKAVTFFLDVVYTSYIYSNETNIESAMNPENVELIETKIHSYPIINQETVTILLIVGIFVLSIAFITIKKFKKR